MALFVPPAGMAELLGEQVVHSAAATVGELLQEIRGRVGDEAWRRFRRAFVMVNGVASSRLGGKRTRLGPQDEVWMVFPAGGG